MMNYSKSYENIRKGGKGDHHWDCKAQVYLGHVIFN